MRLVECYVAKGCGIGLSIAVPKVKLVKDLRALPLEGFDPVSFGVLWTGKSSPILQAFLDTIQSLARTLSR